MAEFAQKTLTTERKRRAVATTIEVNDGLSNSKQSVTAASQAELQEILGRIRAGDIQSGHRLESRIFGEVFYANGGGECWLLKKKDETGQYTYDGGRRGLERWIGIVNTHRTQDGSNVLPLQLMTPRLSHAICNESVLEVLRGTFKTDLPYYVESSPGDSVAEHTWFPDGKKQGYHLRHFKRRVRAGYRLVTLES